MRAHWLALALLFAAPADALVIECPDGRLCATDKPERCGCVQMCDDGSWVFKGEQCSPQSRSRMAARGYDVTTESDPRALADSIASGAMLVAFLVIFFLPGVIASQRSHPNAPAVWLLNLFLGWTALGWVAALAWSLTERSSRHAEAANALPESRTGSRDLRIFLAIAGGAIGILVLAFVVALVRLG